MATQYTDILKLALPTTGELSGTWGDTVNDNITSMVEEAIAGLATIDSWTTNSHTLTTANGTTSESRAAMLVLDDDGAGNPSAAATVICPDKSKLYMVYNNCGQTATIKTSAGTGIAVPNGETAWVYCDGTNVNEALTNIVNFTSNNVDIGGGQIDGTPIGANSASTGAFTSVDINSSTVVDGVLDEDNMASNSATKLATQQSIKAYVDAQVGANNELSEVLANGNTSGGTNLVMSAGDTLTADTIGETTSGAGVTIDSVLLKDDVVNATDVETTYLSANDGTQAAVLESGTGKITIASSVLTTTDINGGTIDNTTIGGATPGLITGTTITANTAVSTDTINEKTSGAGVTIDSVLLKDDVVNATDIEVGSISANDGTQAATIANSTGVMTIASSVLTTADINGGTIDGVTIGGSSAAAGTFTNFSASGTASFTSTSAVTLPVGTEAQRPTPTKGMLRFNDDQDQFEGYDGTDWGGIGGAQAGGAIVTNKDAASQSYTIASGENGLSVGPLTINSGVTITVSSGQRWLVL